jgi:hypothetical protein
MPKNKSKHPFSETVQGEKRFNGNAYLIFDQSPLIVYAVNKTTASSWN